MSISLGFDGVALAALLLMPGLVTLIVMSVILGSQHRTGFEWLGHSLLCSITLNALKLWFTGPIRFSDFQTYEAFRSALPNLPLETVNEHLLYLYSAAVFFGVALGVGSLTVRNGRKWLVFGAGRPTPTDHDSVFNATIMRLEDVVKRKRSGAIWLLLDVDGHRCLGQLRSANLKVARDKPIELFLQPVYQVDDEPILPSLPSFTLCGLYHRLEPGKPVMIFSGAEALDIPTTVPD